MYSVNNSLQRSFGAFSSYICLSSSCACYFSSSSFRLFCCSRLEIISCFLAYSALHDFTTQSLCIVSSAGLHAALACLTAATICRVMSMFFILIHSCIPNSIKHHRCYCTDSALRNNSFFKHIAYYQFFADGKVALLSQRGRTMLRISQ